MPIVSGGHTFSNLVAFVKFSVFNMDEGPVPDSCSHKQICVLKAYSDVSFLKII